MSQPRLGQSRAWTWNCRTAAASAVASSRVAAGEEVAVDHGPLTVGTVVAAVEQLASEGRHQRQGWRLSFAFEVADSVTVSRTDAFDRRRRSLVIAVVGA